MKSNFLTLYGLSNSETIIKGMIEDLQCYKHDFDLRLILTEALTNAFKHGNNMDEKKPIYLKYEYIKETNYITIKIKDSASDLKDINITDEITDDMIENISGRGLFLIQAMSDELYFKENTMVIKKMFELKIKGEVETMNSTEFMIPENFAVEEADKLKQECEEAMKQGKKSFTFNFRQCTFIDSTGLGVLVSIYKKCEENNGYVKLINVNDKDVLRVFKLTRLDEIFNI